MIRPYAQHFIEEMAECFEVVIFTAALRDYAFAIIPLIDPHSRVSTVLTREHTTPYGHCNIKVLI
jgi:TFIIF-interacting CTD phosphatase-like protein